MVYVNGKTWQRWYLEGLEDDQTVWNGGSGTTQGSSWLRSAMNWKLLEHLYT